VRSMSSRDRKLILIIVPIVLFAAYWMLLLKPKREEAAKLGTELTQQQQTRDDAVAQANTVGSMKDSFATDYVTLVRLGKAIPENVDMPSLLLQLDRAARGTHIDFGKIQVGERASAAAASGAAPAPASTTSGAGNGSQPASAGGAQAQSAPGKTSENAANNVNNANANIANNQAANQAATNGQPAPAAGATPPAGGGAANTSSTPGLDTVPLDFTFNGHFFDLADFFHRLKRFVYVANGSISVQGRLMTIDNLQFATDQNDPKKLTATVHATVYLAPKDQGTTAGATPNGPAPAPAPAAGAPQPASGSAPAPSTPPAATVTP
jgi:Tfp pilus assembly protein PilO